MNVVCLVIFGFVIVKGLSVVIYCAVSFRSVVIWVVSVKWDFWIMC